MRHQSQPEVQNMKCRKNKGTQKINVDIHYNYRNDPTLTMGKRAIFKNTIHILFPLRMMKIKDWKKKKTKGKKKGSPQRCLALSLSSLLLTSKMGYEEFTAVNL